MVRDLDWMAVRATGRTVMSSRGDYCMDETSSAQVGEISPAPLGRRRQRAAWLIAGMAVAGITLFVVGLVVGAAVNSHHGKIAAQRAQITAQQKQIRSLRQSLVTADAQAASARAKTAKAQA